MADSVLRNKILAIPDFLDANDLVLINKTAVIADSVSLADYIIVNKVIQVTETGNLVGTVQVGVGGAKKTKLFLILCDLAVQLTGE